MIRVISIMNIILLQLIYHRLCTGEIIHSDHKAHLDLLFLYDPVIKKRKECIFLLEDIPRYGIGG